VGTIRVDELAARLGITPRAAILLLESLGLVVKSQQDRLDDRILDRLREGKARGSARWLAPARPIEPEPESAAAGTPADGQEEPIWPAATSFHDPRKLIRAAFKMARDRGKPDWRRMTTAVLKNRMLLLSERSFHERTYGASTFLAFIPQFDDLVKLDNTTWPPTVEYVEDLSSSDGNPRPAPSEQLTLPTLQSADTHEPEAVVKPDASSTLPPEAGNQVSAASETTGTLPVDASSQAANKAAQEEAIQKCRSAGDLLGAGELLSESFRSVAEPQLDPTFAKLVTFWASPLQTTSEPKDLRELIDRVAEFPEDQLAAGLVNAADRVLKARRELPQTVGDLAFRLSDAVCGLYDIDPRFRPTEGVVAAVHRLRAAHADLQSAVKAFLSASVIAAKQASIGLLKSVHRLTPFVLAAERPLLRELEILLGSAFRKFCESYEKLDGAATLRRATDLREQLQRYGAGLGDSRSGSSLWSGAIDPVIRHVGVLLDEACARSEAAVSPSIRLVTRTVTVDIAEPHREVAAPCRLANAGQGLAKNVTLLGSSTPMRAAVRLLDPLHPFDLAGGTEQLITLGITPRQLSQELRILLRWACLSTSGTARDFEDEILAVQQRVQPHWASLLADPPYTVNPIKRREQLFGRDAVLAELRLCVAAGTSTFLWGPKRVGKTSVLQVLAAEVATSSDAKLVILRIGEVVALHEGQIAQRIAARFAEALGAERPVPSEDEFGAGFNRLVPFMERLCADRSSTRLVLIIDEFDDLDPAFYTGERGKQFIKALRSLSEIGLTFFFVGSERMETIYRRHASDLNKWASVRLDRISSREDCKALVVRPVQGNIDYEDAAVAFIVDYCAGNPFYMHLFCFELFKRCAQERRTFISESDVQIARQSLISTLGLTNFAHLWEDNPELDPVAKNSEAAANCLVLTCIAAAGGQYLAAEDLWEGQARLRLPAADQLPLTGVREACQRLKDRHILTGIQTDGSTAISLPIFRDWLAGNAELQLLPRWRDYRASCVEKEEFDDVISRPVADTLPLPVAEDDLLAVSQRLVYCGRQKDAAEVRRWLRQFDDDNRIELAFQLLRRLAEKGYLTDGARSLALRKVEEMVLAKRRRCAQPWTIVKSRRDNLCITYVDSETKSGAATARDLAKLLQPGKCAPAQDLGAWLKSHLNSDPLVIVVDDFSGTGRTLSTGLEDFMARMDRAAVNQYLSEGRIACFVLFAFPEALSRMRAVHAGLEVMAAEVLGDEVRALSEHAGIFADESEMKFCKDMLLQVGRELTPQNPLGFGDMGALVVFHSSVPNNTLPIFWSNGTVNDRPWHPLFPRAAWS
jgi:hypothetical protein